MKPPVETKTDETLKKSLAESYQFYLSQRKIDPDAASMPSITSPKIGIIKRVGKFGASKLSRPVREKMADEGSVVKHNPGDAI